MDIGSWGAATMATSASAAPAKKSGVVSDYQTFLKMLTTQLQNQDPLNPAKADEFAVQLATFSSVEQQVRTNDLLAALGTQFAAMGMTQFAGWVGMDARAAAPANFHGAPVTLAPAPAAGADRAELVVRDASGRELERFEIPATSNPYVWEGRNQFGGSYLHGLYSFDLVSFRGDTPLASTPVETFGRVIEARMENGQTVIVREGGVIVPTADVTGVRAG